MSKFPHLFKRTIKSLNRKEELISLILILTILISGYLTYKHLQKVKILPKINENDSKSQEIEIYSDGLIGQIKRLNPLFVDLNPVDRDICYLIFSGLSKYDPLSKNFVEDIATHTLSKDKKTYSFTIKPDVKWHDGEKVTADDIYFTYHDIIQNPNFTQNPIIIANFKGVEIKQINNTTVTFTLKAPNSFFFSTLTTGLLPKHLLQNVAVDKLESNDFNQYPIGSGSYRINEKIKKLNESTAQINLKYFEEYYGFKSNIQNIRFTIFPDQESLIKEKASLHAISKITGSEYLQNLREDERFKIYKYVLPQYTALFLNSDSKFLKNKNIRLALSKAIDKEEMIKQLENKTSVDIPLVEPNQNEWQEKPSLDEANGALYDAYIRFATSEDKIRKNRKGENFSLKLIYLQYENNPTLEEETNKVISYIKDKFNKIGCELLLKKYSNSDLQKKILSGEYDLLLYGQNLGYNLDTYAYWHSSQAGKGTNLSNYRSPSADSLIEKIRNTFDNDKKIEEINLLGKTIKEDIAAIFLYTPVYYFAIDNKIENIDLSHLSFPADRYAHIENWKFKSIRNR